MTQLRLQLRKINSLEKKFVSMIYTVYQIRGLPVVYKIHVNHGSQITSAPNKTPI
jgi:hypothetical protein